MILILIAMLALDGQYWAERKVQKFEEGKRNKNLFQNFGCLLMIVKMNKIVKMTLNDLIASSKRKKYGKSCEIFNG